MTRKALLVIVAIAAVGVGLFAISPATRAYAQSIAGYYLTNGQILVGSTGAAPVAATITGSGGVTISNGAGTITASLSTGGIDTTKFNNTTSASGGYVCFTNDGKIGKVTAITGVSADSGKLATCGAF